MESHDHSRLEETEGNLLDELVKIDKRTGTRRNSKGNKYYFKAKKVRKLWRATP